MMCCLICVYSFCPLVFEHSLDRTLFLNLAETKFVACCFGALRTSFLPHLLNENDKIVNNKTYMIMSCICMASLTNSAIWAGVRSSAH